MSSFAKTRVVHQLDPLAMPPFAKPLRRWSLCGSLIPEQRLSKEGRPMNCVICERVHTDRTVAEVARKLTS